MSAKGTLTRSQAISLVGAAAVDKVDAKNCDFTNRVQTDGDTRVEFSAGLNCQDQEGNDVVLTAYYYQEQEAVDAVETLDALKWTVAGYEVT